MLRRTCALFLLSTAIGCSGKDAEDSAAGPPAVTDCPTAEELDPDCESGTAVLRLAVTAGGQPAGAGLSVDLLDCAGTVTTETTDELGEVRMNVPAGEYDITVADLTGVAVQDIQIAKAVYLESL